VAFFGLRSGVPPGTLVHLLPSGNLIPEKTRRKTTRKSVSVSLSLYIYVFICIHRCYCHRGPSSTASGNLIYTRKINVIRCPSLSLCIYIYICIYTYIYMSVAFFGLRSGVPPGTLVHLFPSVNLIPEPKNRITKRNSVFVSLYVCMHVCMHIYILFPTGTLVHLFSSGNLIPKPKPGKQHVILCLSLCIYIYTCIGIYICIYICTHTHTHIYTHPVYRSTTFWCFYTLDV